MIPTAIVNQRGMITIPKIIRKKNHINAGTEIAILDLGGTITLVPILTEEQLQENRIPHHDMIQMYEQSKIQDVENEL